MHYNYKKTAFYLAVPFMLMNYPLMAKDSLSPLMEIVQQADNEIISVQKINNSTVEVLLKNQQRMTIDFYGNNIFRLFQDSKGGILRAPVSNPPAEILVKNPRKNVEGLEISEEGTNFKISTESTEINLEKASGLLSVINKKSGKKVLEFVDPVKYERNKTLLTLKEGKDEYFYGGGVQNGRFSHKGKSIAIENQNSWTDGGVASPTPFYWSTQGYGIMFYTFKKGRYDFGATDKGKVKLYHESDYLDVFFMIDEGVEALLNDFYQLTGNPVLLPKFGFYQGHLNAYNRDYWKEDETGILFEDGKRYKESQKDNGGIKESLNGEKNNYQFSARAVIDRYKQHDMPLGWILPNDGYGAGYGQTETLDGNIQNLKEFGDYARKNGVEIGLWTQSDLHPKDSISALLQRDIVKEVRDAGVRVLKTDVAWVGPGYSFGLNGIADVGHIMPYYANEARPFIISLDGWAGSQRYAGIWSGDQTGGVWEYIRFHIPTYIGSGLSGQPNITSDMDGIFGGKNPIINTRDFQWKTFTPMELNMDGWGANEKYPHALGEPVTSINRYYLKLKSSLLPYTYSIARESVDGLPMIRAMFLEEPNAYTLGKSTQYQFMYGPYFLVAPIYQNTQSDKEGNDLRNGIYLPQGQWIDYFSGSIYQGERIINNFAAPLWKLPVFVKAGAIIPLHKAHNNVKEINYSERILEFYPCGQSSFTLYDDDGRTEAYKLGSSAKTQINSSVDGNKVNITVSQTEGIYEGMQKEASTTFVVNLTQKPKKITARIGNKSVKLKEVSSITEVDKQENVFYYDASPNLNRFATAGSSFAEVSIRKTPQLYVKLQTVDITSNPLQVEMTGFVFNPTDPYKKSLGALTAPSNAKVKEENIGAYTVRPTWDKVEQADYYEIQFNNMLYSTIQDSTLLFEDLQAETTYNFQIRSVNKEGVSDWVSFQTTTKSNPLEFAIQGIVAQTSAANQRGQGIEKLFDFDESNSWHTRYSTKAVPFEMIVDLKSFNQLDKIHYIPRSDVGNGTILKGKLSYSLDKENWIEAGNFSWDRNGDTKIFTFKGAPKARYIRMQVEEAVGNYGSGRELYVFKVPGSESYIPGDINNDGLLDANDLTSYTNYTGLRQGDSDFEGYISGGDLNKNGLIDAYDISTLTTALDGGVRANRDTLAGTISLIPSKKQLTAGETFSITVNGKNLKAVNALSFALPYSNSDFEFVSIEPIAVNTMENLTNDRLHSNGTKSLYPTFVHIGNQTTIQGDVELFRIHMKAKRKINYALKATDGFLVDKNLNSLKF